MGARGAFVLECGIFFARSQIDRDDATPGGKTYRKTYQSFFGGFLGMKMIWRGANQRGRFGAVAEARGSVAPAGPRRLARPVASGRYKNDAIRIPGSKSNKRRPPAFKLFCCCSFCNVLAPAQFGFRHPAPANGAGPGSVRPASSNIWARQHRRSSAHTHPPTPVPKSLGRLIIHPLAGGRAFPLRAFRGRNLPN